MAWVADKELREKRRAICRDCPFATGGKPGKRVFCGKCGCVIAGKTAVADATCPIGKW